MDLFKLLGTIAIDNKDANKALDETGGKGEGAHSKLSGAFSKIGKGAAVVGKAVATGMAAGATAISGLAMAAVNSYASYEQLKGGVETLFGAGGKTLEEYAESVGKSVAEVKGEYDTLMASQTAVLDHAKNA